MRLDPQVPDAKTAATRLQHQALDPQATIWVEASAGSGKTKVLVDRCLRLLLDGTKPERLLCITFTKAAASEMASRLMQTLSYWVARSETDLEADLDSLLGRHPTESESRIARQLFALVLDTPGGLKVQTLHAFCQAVLTRFPLEADVSPGFRALEERDAAALMAAAREDLMQRVALDGALRQALSRLLVAEGEEGVVEVAGLVAQQRDALLPLLDQGTLPPLLRLAERLDLAFDADPDGLLAEALDDTALPLAHLPLIEAAFTSGSKVEQEKAQRLAAFRTASVEERVGLFHGYAALFLANAGTKRSLRSALLTKAAKAAVPEAEAAMVAEGERLLDLEVRVTAARCFRVSEAALILAKALLDAYEHRKRLSAALDYQDLLQKTDALLARPGIAAWVLYKLDGGLDHVLIDEAQDTAPLQWRIVTRLTEEFYSGEGAQPKGGRRPRSVFAVGDPKQSIYRFQGADPAGFQAAARRYGGAVLGVGQRFLHLALTHSFRSTPAVLAAVDAVFERAEPLTQGAYAPHQAIRAGAAGLVQLRPRHLPELELEDAPWAPPLTQTAMQSPAAALAEEVASLVADWLGAKDPRPGDEAWLTARDRPIAAGDILILVRRRDQLFHLLARALEKRGVPIAGIDRMLLSQQLAVMDLVALGQVLLLPEDDLTLASVLKGPLFGLEEESLYRLAQPRAGSLWAALREQRREEPAWTAAYEELSALRARLDFQPPFDLFAELLGAGGGRKRLCARLGEEAGDPLDEFLALALTYEQEEAASLQGFLGWLTRSEVSVKRDMEAAADKVRLMTVHGAKGLQAPLVLLPDTRARQSPPQRILIDREAGLFLHRQAEMARVPALAELIERRRQADAAEERRLLYVAMTRAEDRLYLLGYQGKRATQGESWYDLLQSGMTALCGAPDPDDSVKEEEDEAPQDRLLCHENPQGDAVRPDRPASAQAPATPLPAWTLALPAAEPDPGRPLSPSRPSQPDPPTLSPLVGQLRPGLTRGRLVHRLLQLLPDLPEDERPAAARRFLAQPAWALEPGPQEEIAAETLAVLTAPEAAALFGPGSRAEVPIAGLVGKTRIAGQIDRLAISPEALLLVDYKTNRPSPEREADVPRPYLQQLAAYAALLAGLYPGLPLRCFLLWTETARLMHISDDRISQAGVLTAAPGDPQVSG
ncbi:MAG: double-strand break repair helicase AddA [Rhodospirillales bacterium]